MVVVVAAADDVGGCGAVGSRGGAAGPPLHYQRALPLQLPPASLLGVSVQAEVEVEVPLHGQLPEPVGHGDGQVPLHGYHPP